MPPPLTAGHVVSHSELVVHDPQLPPVLASLLLPLSCSVLPESFSLLGLPLSGWKLPLSLYSASTAAPLSGKAPMSPESPDEQATRSTPAESAQVTNERNGTTFMVARKASRVPLRSKCSSHDLRHR